MMAAVRIGRSRNGKGIFALRSIGRGQVLFQIKGKFISGDVSEKISKEARDNAFRYDADIYITPGKHIAKFVNHSCDPNAKIAKKGSKLFIIALKKIEKGEEISFDYSTTLASDDSWTMKCNCGSKNCRKVIKNFHTLPKPLQKNYISRGMVPKYIREN